jgi:ribosomal protein S18 acetylase RimI-like enzyme
MTGGFSIELATGDTTEALLEPVCQLYASVFTGPPFNRSQEKIEAQRRTLASLMKEPAFGLATASEADSLVGFAYGYGLRGDTRWWDGFLTPVDEKITREWNGRTFVIIDLAVASSHRFRGIGKMLLAALLASRDEERASLAVIPENDGAQSFYRRLGWQHVGRVKGAPHHVAPFFDIYVLPINR